MTERIIDFLDALVATVGAVDRRYCLVEKRADFNGTNIPYKYKGNGNYEAVNVDGGSVSYWRIVNSISFDVVDGNKAVKNLQATYPIRYVAMVRRDDINPLTFSQDVANVLEGRNKDLQTQLQAKNVNITVGSIDTDTVKIWGEEFSMPLSEPNYTRSMVMIDLTLTVIAARSCWESCDDFPDILQGFDWCDPSTYQRLTQAQQTCLEGFLCGTCADATVQLNGTTVATPPSGGAVNIPVTQGGSPVGSWNGSALIIPPCPTPPSITLAVSDSAPDLGDSITITATPSAGYVPTSYTFTIPRINGDAISVTQTGAGANIYTWTAEGNGTVTINVCSTDGTDTAANMIDVDVTFPFIADEYADMSTSWGLFKASESYLGNWAQFQRQSDGAYLEVGWINDCVADLQSLRNWAGLSRARMTILYDSTGNGNHAVQSTQSLQLRQVEGNVKIGSDGLLWTENSNRMLVQSGGTTPPNASSYVDVYCSCDISYDGGWGTILPVMQRSVNQQFMLRGDASSSSTAINNVFGSPTYYLNGSLSGWSTRGDVYTALYRTGRNQITIIGGNTSGTDWLLGPTIGGSQDFGRYWEGGMGMYWFWVASTASVRTEIESKYNRLCALNIR